MANIKKDWDAWRIIYGNILYILNDRVDQVYA